MCQRTEEVVDYTSIKQSLRDVEKDKIKTA